MAFVTIDVLDRQVRGKLMGTDTTTAGWYTDQMFVDDANNGIRLLQDFMDDIDPYEILAHTLSGGLSLGAGNFNMILDGTTTGATTFNFTASANRGGVRDVLQINHSDSSDIASGPLRRVSYGELLSLQAGSNASSRFWTDQQGTCYAVEWGTDDDAVPTVVFNLAPDFDTATVVCSCYHHEFVVTDVAGASELVRVPPKFLNMLEHIIVLLAMQRRPKRFQEGAPAILNMLGLMKVPGRPITLRETNAFNTLAAPLVGAERKVNG
jgi:hypothetical protein